MNEGVVSKETVVLRRWGSSIQKFGFINGVDKCKLATVQILKADVSSVSPSSERLCIPAHKIHCLIDFIISPSFQINSSLDLVDRNSSAHEVECWIFI